MKRRSPVTFTHHAFKRIDQRASITSQEIAGIIEMGKYVPIGREGNRVHKVFYSPVDKQYFVIIHDEEKNEVVTVLPPDFHHRWEISGEVFNTAKALAET